MAEYEPEQFWTEVAGHIAQRSDGSVEAGDDTPYYRYKRERFLERFLDSLGVAGARVLEVGCGPGGNLLRLSRQRPARLVGVDISQQMLDLAGAMLEREHIPAELFKTDGASLPFNDRSFDLAMTVTVLHHNLDEKTFLALVAEMCRVTSDRVVLVEDTNPVVKQGDATIERPIAVYEQALRTNGFALASTEFLDTRATFFVHRAVMKTSRTLTRRQHVEGAPISKGLTQALNAGVAVAKPFDNLWHDHCGLTKMTFTRAG